MMQDLVVIKMRNSQISINDSESHSSTSYPSHSLIIPSNHITLNKLLLNASMAEMTHGGEDFLTITSIISVWDP